MAKIATSSIIWEGVDEPRTPAFFGSCRDRTIPSKFDVADYRVKSDKDRGKEKRAKKSGWVRDPEVRLGRRNKRQISAILARRPDFEHHIEA